MIVDAVINARFLTPEEGGRNGAVQGIFYGCPLIKGGKAFDCRMLLAGQRIELGVTYQIPLKFLFSQDALQEIFVGDTVAIWEGHEVGSGVVIWKRCGS